MCVVTHGCGWLGGVWMVVVVGRHVEHGRMSEDAGTLPVCEVIH